MSTGLRRAFWAGCSVGVVACSVYTEDLLDGTGGGAGAGASGDCLSPDDCPGSDRTCRYRVCLNGACGMQDAEAGTTCDTNGGSYCDGEGNCVECLNEQHCDQGQSCSADNECQDGKAQNGAPCSSPAACQSDLCVDDVCCSAVCDGICQACDVDSSEGSCTNVPADTDPDSECSGGDMCNGAGACRCDDNQTNGNETAPDCGGPDCDGCANGLSCNDHADCLSSYCDGTCQAPPTCGNGNPDGGEECDDNNTDSFDGCSAECLDPTDHLLISEVALTPSAGEFIEIYNPTTQAVDLSNVYLADRNTYYLVTQGPVSTGAYDFVVKFPQGASIGSQSFVVVSVKSATDYSNTYSTTPDYDMDGGDLGAPAMEGTIGGSAGLTDAGEMIVLFTWDGVSDLVSDLDYLLWGNTNNAADKTGITVGNGTYLADTLASSQAFAPSETTGGETLHRCDTAEDTETQTGGNGTSGHDETSEDCSLAWKRDAPPSPGAAPASGFCP